MIKILRSHLDEIYLHAKETDPAECCGLIGGKDNLTSTVYRLRNIATDPLIAYEAAPEDLFVAQRSMRKENEELYGIYHSHPRSYDPVPSETDVRLAFYPSVFHLIVGLAGDAPTFGLFHISEADGYWERAKFSIIENQRLINKASSCFVK
jgi:[CysO sulfur-carrier protein]-S-L-cysteine hydrolase